MKATNAADVALPIEYVPLEHLKTSAGEPVIVRCEAVSEMVLAEIWQALPGGRPPDVRVDSEGNSDPLDQMRSLNSYAPRLIEAGCVLEGPEGSEVRPAFFFEDQAPLPADFLPGHYGAEAMQELFDRIIASRRAMRNPLSIPGRLLRESDKILLVAALMRCGGYGGAAGAEVFPQERGGSGDGGGVMEAGEGVPGAPAPDHGDAPIEP